MTVEEEKLLSTFETKLRHLIYLHDDLKRENSELKLKLEKEKAEKETLTAKLEQLNKDYTNLKTAAAIGLNGDNAKETKHRIDKLVREIDLCIGQLE